MAITGWKWEESPLSIPTCSQTAQLQLYRWARVCVCVCVCGRWAVRCISKMTTSRSIVSDTSFVFILLLVSSSPKPRLHPSQCFTMSNILPCTQACICMRSYTISVIFACVRQLFESSWWQLSWRVEVIFCLSLSDGWGNIWLKHLLLTLLHHLLHHIHSLVWLLLCDCYSQILTAWKVGCFLSVELLVLELPPKLGPRTQPIICIFSRILLSLLIKDYFSVAARSVRAFCS